MQEDPLRPRDVNTRGMKKGQEGMSSPSTGPRGARASVVENRQPDAVESSNGLDSLR